MIFSRSLRYLAVFAAVVLCLEVATGQSDPSAHLSEYHFGTPSDDETAILKLINPARANPTAEGQRLAVALKAAGNVPPIAEVLADFPTYPFRPPLAFNAKLMAAAAAHNADMIATGVQQHNSSDGMTPGERVRSFGYAIPAAENISGTKGYPAMIDSL